MTNIKEVVSTCACLNANVDEVAFFGEELKKLVPMKSDITRECYKVIAPSVPGDELGHVNLCIYGRAHVFHFQRDTCTVLTRGRV